MTKEKFATIHLIISPNESFFKWSLSLPFPLLLVFTHDKQNFQKFHLLDRIRLLFQNNMENSLHMIWTLPLQIVMFVLPSLYRYHCHFLIFGSSSNTFWPQIFSNPRMFYFILFCGKKYWLLELHMHETVYSTVLHQTVLFSINKQPNFNY